MERVPAASVDDVARMAKPPGAPLAGARIGLVTAWASRAGGGVFEAVTQQAALIRKAGGCPMVFALAEPQAEGDRERFGDTRVVHCRVLGPAQIGYAPGLGRALRAANLDLVHLHGIWMHPSAAAADWARATRLPYVISPHGMLDPWITARGRWKKTAARWAYERASWRAATAFHALTNDEAADIARETGHGDQLIIPNAAPKASAAVSPERSPCFLYLGRIHPKKNLDALLAAWALQKRAVAHAGAELRIAGWGEPGHVAALRRAVAAAGPSVRFVGAAHGEDKAHLLASARFLLLPSLSEGLPMAALEAWAAGTPTVMTPACHLPQGFATGAALRCDASAPSIAAALGDALAMEGATWRRRQAAALALAGGPFAPATVAAQWVAAYARLAGRP